MSQAPRTYSQNDRHFRFDTEHHLIDMMAAALKHMNRAIRVELHDDAVFLTGDVHSWAEKQQAQEAIRRTTGSRVISNQLNVPGF